MKKRVSIVLLLLFPLSSILLAQNSNSAFINFTVKPSQVKFYWKDEQGQPLKSIQSLKSLFERKKEKLRFATNGGMYKADNSPQGLFIENGKTIVQLDTLSGDGNFYLKPNGVFYLTEDSEAFICEMKKFAESKRITYATQSGPMLLIDGQIHPAFRKNSTNLNVRNGVGILPDGSLIFAMSKQQVNFYEFAEFFKSLGCANALYLDGFVSRTYLPEKKWKQLDGNFGVMIGVSD